MQITSVKMRMFSGEKLKTDVTIVIDDMLLISRIRIIYDDQKKRFFLAMPGVRDKSGKRYDIFHPINSETRQMIEAFLLQFYEYAEKNQKTQIEMVLKDGSQNSCIQQQSINDFLEREVKGDFSINAEMFSITSFQIYRNSHAMNLHANVSFTIDNIFAVHNLKIVHNGYRDCSSLYMPFYETVAHRKKEIIHPIHRVLREKLEDIFFSAYEMLLNRKVDTLTAKIVEGKKKSLHLQTISDFDVEFAGNAILEDTRVDNRKFDLVEMAESIEERIYKSSSCVLEKVIEQKNSEYICGKIVGYADDSYYKVHLVDGRIGKIQCELMDQYEKVIDYKNGLFQTYVPNDTESIERNDFLRHINKDYYFEVIGQQSDNQYILSIQNVQRDYLDYVIENECILQGTIIQIDDNHVGIGVPYGYVFFTSVVFVFGCRYDLAFEYRNYLGSEVSVILTLQKDTNKLLPIIATAKYNLLINDLNYIFPVLTSYEGSYFSKLWLDKNLLLMDRRKKYPLKHINQLFVVWNIREKGILTKSYKGNIRRLFSENQAQKCRMNILSVGWLINLKGYNEITAIQYLEQKGFFYSVEYTYSLSVESGIILSMKPDINHRAVIPRNILVCLTISKGRRQEYVLPDFKGMHIKEVREILGSNKLDINCEVSNEKIEGIAENCVIYTRPTAGSVLISGNKVKVTIYQKNKYESPFVLRENEIPKITFASKVAGTEGAIIQFCNTVWHKVLLVFILKHKVANLNHLQRWLFYYTGVEISSMEITDALKYLKYISMVGSATPVSDVTENVSLHFYFPAKNLYEKYKDDSGYYGRFFHYGKDIRYYKTRAAENQALLKLYDILREDYILKYEVDCLQIFLFDEIKQYLKIHIAVCADNALNNDRKVFFIEAIRFLDDDQLLEGWKKLIRYSMYINKQYDITPSLILVLEDEVHFQRFIDKRPPDCNLSFIDLYYTWDQLTNMEGKNFENFFRRI